MGNDDTERNLKVFFIAAALGALVLALYDSRDEYQDNTITEPPAHVQQLTPAAP